MSVSYSMGKTFRLLTQTMKPLQIVGTINAYCALLAEQVGFKAIYLSGAGIANASYGMPDLGVTNLQDVLDDVIRIVNVSKLPLLVDIDTGFGNEMGIARTIKRMERSGVAAVHIEDQVAAKRCGHRPNKALVSKNEMMDRIKAAVDARVDPDFVIMARTDAYANEGLNGALERADAYIDAGADMIFAEAFQTLAEFERFTQAVNVPVLANMTEFGKTPLFPKESLHKAGIQLALYPLSAFRAMSNAALSVYKTIYEQGSQLAVVNSMQTREELYDVLGYLQQEKQLDKLVENDNGQ